MAAKKRQSLAASTKPTTVVDPAVLDAITSAIHENTPATGSDIESTVVSRLSVDLDADLFAEMKVHCARNKVKIKNYIEILLRSDLNLT